MAIRAPGSAKADLRPIADVVKDTRRWSFLSLGAESFIAGRF